MVKYWLFVVNTLLFCSFNVFIGSLKEQVLFIVDDTDGFLGKLTRLNYMLFMGDSDGKVLLC